MKRGAVGIAGFAFGLFWVWFCLYSLGHMEWAKPRMQHSCIDAGDCTWPGIFAAISYVLVPPIIFGVLNWAAWRRWPARKWAGWFLGLSLLTGLSYAVMAVVTKGA